MFTDIEDQYQYEPFNHSLWFDLFSTDTPNGQEPCNSLASSSVDLYPFLSIDTTNNDSSCQSIFPSPVAPATFLRRASTPSVQYNFDEGPQEMRNRLAASHGVDANLVGKYFSKEAKANVATPKSRRASAARRKSAAKFTCSFEGCSSDFTRKHNLDSK